jgi:hypothetical protein
MMAVYSRKNVMWKKSDYIISCIETNDILMQQDA